MKHRAHIRYAKSLTYCPKLAGCLPTNIVESWRQHMGPYARQDRQPHELAVLAGNVTSTLSNLYGHDLKLADVRRLLREWTAFRDRFHKVARDQGYDEKNSLPDELKQNAVALVRGYIGFGFCREDFDAHIKALRHLWFGPTNRVCIETDWSFNIPVDERRRFLASQYALAALLYVDAAQLAVRHGKGFDTVNYSLRGAHALHRAIEFRALSPGRIREQIRTEIGRDAALKRHRTSDKAIAKLAIYGRFENWRANRERHENDSQFANAMREAYPVFKNPQTIQKWLPKWRRGEQIPVAD